ncbi:hypothetical protein LIER_31627 [Lithospermum erythrorhizon]|uniref:Aminotransferase-like plant mobile domain-containing protein n=1 Tax=Lithospermum erythrorhizon TaxID=34254 RepID=A0AAV3RV64_LITER
MPFGEMTITLHDVHAILGLNINDLAVSGETPFYDDELLPQIGTRSKNKSSAFLTSIVTTCDDPTMSQQFVARGYIWYLLGTTLFPDKSQDGVPIRYLQLLHDLEVSFPHSAWGATTLAYLYHQLGMASKHGVKQISGCLTLLECWIYEYFPMYARVSSPSWIPRPERIIQPHSMSCGLRTALQLTSLPQHYSTDA